MFGNKKECRECCDMCKSYIYPEIDRNYRNIKIFGLEILCLDCYERLRKPFFDLFYSIQDEVKKQKEYEEKTEEEVKRKREKLKLELELKRLS